MKKNLKNKKCHYDQKKKKNGPNNYIGIFPKKTYHTNSQQVCGKMLNISNHKRNANKNKNKIFSSVTQSCLTLCEPMTAAHQTSSHHQLSELAQTYVHQVGDAIQPSHPLSPPSPPAFNLSSRRVFYNESAICIR